jgi:simple sugar transport system substrate-binding protein
MNRPRLLILLATLSIVALLGTSCAPAQPTAAPAGSQSAKPYEIVFVPKLTGIPWFSVMETGLKEAGKDLGVNVSMVGPAQADPAQQVKVIEDLVAKGVDAILVTPNDAKSLEPVFAKAKEKGIKIITHESPDQQGNDLDLEMIDNKLLGEHTFDLLAKCTGGSGEYAILVGSLTVPGHNAWADAGVAYAKEKYPGLTQVTDRIPASEDQDLSRQKTLELMKAYPNLKGVVGFGSLGPPGAAQAVKEKGMEDKVCVVGTVLPAQGEPYLKDGSLDAGVLWSPKDAGYVMTWMAKQLLDGKQITDGEELPRIGKIKLNDRVVQANAVLDINKDNALTFGF